MFYKNLTTRYKLYSKNLQALRNRILPEKNKIHASNPKNVVIKADMQLMKSLSRRLRGITTVKEKCTNKLIVFSNVANTKLQDSRTNRIPSQVELKQILTWASSRNKSLLCSTAGIAAITGDEALQTASTTTVPLSDVAQPAPIVETSQTAPTSLLIEPIPEPPPIPDAELLTEAVNHLNALGEPTFASLGLGGWSPVGMVQTSLEYLHVTLDLPWWGAIAIGTVVVRLLMFPLVIIAQRNAAKMNNYLPQLQAIQVKMTEARQCGNQIDVARYSQEMMIFMKEKDLNPLKNMIVPLAQMPLFISFFMGLRKMANLPVDSLREGGMLWFTDLTVPDQFFALPIITSITLWTTIELGTDSARLSSQNMQTMKYVLRALPVIIFPFTVNFPGAILMYWVSSNFISLAQVGFLRIPKVRDYFRIEPLVRHDPQKMPIKSKGFVGGLKESWTNVKITRELEERRRFDELQFQRAGRGPVVKTYKYDPTKQTNPNAISAKKR